MARARRANRLLVRELKAARGCESCGYAEDPDRLHLHHRDPASKTHEISYMVRWGTARLIEEVAKCDVLCWDCHLSGHFPGMGKPVVSLRIDPEVLAWVDAYADERGSSRTAVIDAALASFREDAARGAPDVRPKSGGAPLGPVRTTHRAARAAKTGEESKMVEDFERLNKKSIPAFLSQAQPKGSLSKALIARQAKLNKAKEKP